MWLCILVGLLGESPAASGAQVANDTPAAIRLGASAGTRRYRAGRWGVVAVNASNPTDRDAELTAVVYLADDPTLQYGRRIWVPARSILRSTCPIQIPDGLSPNRERVDIVSAPVDPVTGADVTRRSQVEAVDGGRPLIVFREPVAVGIIGDFQRPSWPVRDVPFYTGPEKEVLAPDEVVYELVQAGKTAEELSARVSVLNAREMPAESAGLDALDVLVVSTDQVALDPDAVALIRGWVLGGGNLWIMLDELSEVSAAAILGESFTSTVVDRVQLTDLKIESVRTDVPPQEPVLLTFDEPVAFARVLPGNVTIMDTVNGWPATFWQPFGAGKVFYSTLAARAWIESPSPEAPPVGAAAFQSPPPGENLLKPFVAECFAPSNRHSQTSVDVAPVLARQIGYRILGRKVVMSVLIVFCLVLGAVGFWCRRTGRLGRLLWTVPLAAAATSFLFVAVAASARNSVPPTAAIWQKIDLEPGLAAGRICGLASLYNPEISDARMGATQGGLFMPDMAAMRGQRRRMMWSDEGVWQWQDLNLPPGIRTAPLQQVLHLETPVGCRARFGPSGLTGLFGPAPFTGLTDAVITLPHQPLLAVKMGPGGSFAAGMGDVLAPGEFLADTWLSDAGQRHADIYRLALQTQDQVSPPSRPILHIWADPVDQGFVFPQTNRLGSALVSIPLQIERSLAGSDVIIPASFIPYRGAESPDGKRPTAYNAIRGEWADSQYAICQWLRFQMPPSVLPLEVRRAVISLSLRAPSRSVDVLALDDRQPVVVKSLTHPIGTFEVVLDQPELLRLDGEGGLAVAIRVSGEESADLSDLMAVAPWKIESLCMAVVGKVRGE